MWLLPVSPTTRLHLRLRFLLVVELLAPKDCLGMGLAASVPPSTGVL